MKKTKKIDSVALLLAVLIAILFGSQNALSQCTNTTNYPTTAITAPTNGASVTITAAQWAGDYATIVSVVAGSNYISTSSVSGDFITIRQGSYNGTLVASGTTPLVWTATVNGTYYIHYNTNSSCGTQSVNRTTTISNVLMVPASGNNSATSCLGHIYDNGGPNGDYSANSNGYTVIYPCASDNKVQLTGSYRTENNNDHVYIYNGVGTGGTLLLDGAANNSTSIGTITSTDASGALTVRFVSNGSTQRSGFDFTIACIDPCLTKNVPYSQNFESVITPAIPSCTSVQTIGVGNSWQAADAPGFGFTGKVLEYSWSASYGANTWFYTPGINLTGGTSYRIVFKYGNVPDYPEKLRVAYGTSATAASMTTTLLDFSNIDQGSPQNASYDFTPSTTGVYYIGFNAYSNANMYYLLVDDIQIDLSSNLPVSLISFTGECDGDKVTLKWSTATETNNSHFTIEKSKNGIDWDFLQQTDGAGNSNQQIDYSTTDQADNSLTYYRLKQTDYDGKFEIFPAIVTKCKNNYSNIKVYPNPTKDLLNIESPNSEITQIEIKNSLGQTIAQFFDNLKTISLSDLKPGIYLIKVRDSENKETIFKVIKE